MPIVTKDTWKLWFASLSENDEGNRNMVAFTNALNAGRSDTEKIKTLTDNKNYVFLAADRKKSIKIFHSPINFGGTMLRPTNKVVCLTGMGRSAVCVHLDIPSTISDCKIVTPTVEELAACETAEAVGNLIEPNPIPEEEGFFSYEGSNIMIPAPWLRDAIIAAETTKPFELIPIAIQAARAYDEANDNEDQNRAILHADDFCSWAWGVAVGRVPEAIVEIDADDIEAETYRVSRHLECITNIGVADGGNAIIAPAVGAVHGDILQQLTASIARQSEEAATSNLLRREEIDRKKDKDDQTKDRTKKIHSSIIRMLELASAITAADAIVNLAESCKSFLNAENKGLAEQTLTHQFEERGLTEVALATGTVQALFHGEFLYSDPSTPSNFTAFAFFEQQPLCNTRQHNYLTCSLIQQQGQRLTLEEIKASLKQEVVVPKDFTELGTQLQLFVGAVGIFFGDESIPALAMRRVLLLLGRHKLQFRASIAQDEWFPAKFLFAIDKRFQRWLGQCKRSNITRMEINDRILDLDDIVDLVLNGTFTMTLPLAFKKTTTSPNNETRKDDKDEPKAKKQKQDDKRKKDDSKTVTNEAQHPDLKLRDGEDWKGKFQNAHASDRPSWDGTKSKKMCIRWHLKGNCYDNCSRKESHVPASEIPSAKLAEAKAFLAKCRSE